MNWVKKNPFLTGFLAVVIIVAGALGYLLYQGYTTYTTVSEEYDSRVAKLQSLQNRSPFPSDENNRKYVELTSAYKQEYENLLAQVSKMQIPLEPLSPQAFQDRLRRVVSEVEAAAAAASVSLPEGFYMGFDKYKGQLPSDAAATPLGRQLAAVKMVVDRLIEFRVTAINSINRSPLPEEPEGARKAEEPARRPTAGGRPPSRQQEPEPSMVSTNSFEIVFQSGQQQLRQVLNAIVSADQFFIIRNMTVLNSSPEGPKRTGEPAAGTPQEPGRPGDIKVVVGRESLTVGARIEMLTFITPEARQ